tara:strand:+ start:420 stop:719 length:300 start_codon:yes stop_codon:yes gene_type:complete
MKLTNNQRDALINQYIEVIVGSMSVDELVNLGMNKLQEEFDSYDLDALKSKIRKYDPELFDKLLDEVLTEYPSSTEEREPFEPVQKVSTKGVGKDMDLL